jgi:UrcA family protein
MTIRFIAAAGAIALLASTAPAFAKTGAPADDTSVSVAVPLAGLNLDTRAGAEAALRRIARAARQTCGDLSLDLSPPDRTNVRDCRQAAVQGAIAALNRPAVTAQAKTGDWAKLADR